MSKARNKKRPKLGAGAYESNLNGEEKSSKKDAQGYFLEAVKQIVPKALEDLSREPFNLYRQIPELCFKADAERLQKIERLNLYDQIRERFKWENYTRTPWKHIEIPFVNPLHDPTLSDDDEHLNRALINHNFRGGVIDPTPADKDGRIATFKDSLLEWSRKYNLDEIWVRERAYNTLEEWSAKPEWFEHRYWKFEINYPHPFIAGGEPRFVFDRRTQYPLYHSRREDFELAVEEFKRQYAEFQKRIEESLKAGGYTPAPVKPPDNHFEWLVYYHIQGWDYSRIAELYKMDDDSHLRHKVPELARFIGLRLKKRRGRPRKN